MMTVRSKILEVLEAGPATSTEIADKTGEMRGRVKVALVTMVKREMVLRERIVREGKGPKSQYCYTLRIPHEIQRPE
jgi:predicted transcriptional regulator